METWTAPPLPPRMTASRRTPLVGRRNELEIIERVWSGVEDGNRQVVFIGGEPGAGKTRFAAEVAGILHDNGATVLVGTSSVDAGAPYEAFREILDDLFGASPRGSLAHLMGEDSSELRRLSHAVERHHPGVEFEAGAHHEVRRELFDAVAAFFRNLAGERPLVLVLDDLHWAQIPTLALFEHVVAASPDVPLLVLAAFRTTLPDRSEELTRRVADLHRFDGVRRIDLGGLDTEAIADYLRIRGGVAKREALGSATILRDKTGGNPFFLRELWLDLEGHGGLNALRSSHRVPISIGDTLARRLSGMGQIVRDSIEMAAILGDNFDLGALIAANDASRAATMASIDSAIALGLVEPVAGTDGVYSFVHSLTRQAVIDRMAPSRVALRHAQAAEALDTEDPDSTLIPRLARHYLASHVMGHPDRALHYATRTGRLAEHSLAYEEAAQWYERAAALPEIDSKTRPTVLAQAAANHLKAGDFSRARTIYDGLTTVDDPEIALAAAMGYEDANWRPGLVDAHAADLLTSALEASGLDENDPRYVRGLASLGRALAFAGDTERARRLGSRAIELARALDDTATLSHALKTSLWHGLTPDMAEIQLERSTELSRLARDTRDYDDLGPAAYFRAMVGYLRGEAQDLAEAIAGVRRTGQANGQPFFVYLAACMAGGMSLMKGDFDGAERRAYEALRLGDAFGPDAADGPHGVQMFMVRRETGGLEQFRPLVDGREAFHGRWVPGLLALYTELGITVGIQRTLRHLLNREMSTHTSEAQWPMELVFMTDGALALEDIEAVTTLRPFLAEYEGMNLMAGQFVAPFGSADRYLARTSSLLGDTDDAERLFLSAVEMDRSMGSITHTAESLAYHGLFVASTGDTARAASIADMARDLAAPIGQIRVLKMLETFSSDRPVGLTGRETDVLALLAQGLSNREIGERLFISANTAANHVRSILMKTGASNRTQAAVYWTDHQS